MALSATEQKRIIAQESAWIDDGTFGQLDLSAFPALQPPPPAETHDNRFARDWRDTALSASASELRKFIANPDTESLQRVGDELGHEDFRDEVRQRRGETVAEQFKKKRPDYLQTDRNYEAIVTTLSFNCLSSYQQEGTVEEQVKDLIDGQFWTVGNLVATYDALDAAGLLEIPAGTARRLTSSERLKVVRLAQDGQLDAAIGEYLRGALDGEEPTIDLITDPAYVNVCNEAVLYVFEVGETSYMPTPERREFLLRYAAGRPLHPPLLQQAWAACQANEIKHERGQVLGQFQRHETEPPTVKEIDALDDDQVDELFHSSLRAYANSVRQSPGIIA
jgi:hypothetical protein